MLALYNQAEELERIMAELAEQPLVFSPNVFQEEAELVVFDGEIRVVQPTTLRESVSKILQEDSRMATSEVCARFAPLVRERVKELVEEIRPEVTIAKS